MCEEDKCSSVCRTVIEIDFPAFPFLHTHPRTLEREVADKMAGQPHEQAVDGETEKHGTYLYVRISVEYSLWYVRRL